MQGIKNLSVIAALSAVQLLSACGTSSAPLAPSTTTVAASTGTKRPNVLIILADDLGYSDIGAYGSEIHTPNLDALASAGTVLTNFHSTPLCSPTRADLLTGADHHIVGVGGLIQTTLPYQTGEDYGGFNDKARTIAEILQDAGYHTYMAGKWHMDAKGPQQWGFEHSFALAPTAGNGNNFPPYDGGNGADEPWYEDGTQVTVPADFFSSDYYASKLISYIDAERGDGRPFFAYLAFQATHNPIQAPAAYLDRYAGAYDAGYETIRAARIAKQKALGLIPQDFLPSPGLPITSLSPSNPEVLLNTPWSALTPGEQQTEARQMEIYAAMTENMDADIGQVIDYLKQSGQYDNTLIVFMSDNGPDGNGDVNPSGTVDNSLANYGKPGSYITRSVGWSLVSSAPFKGFKASIFEGGTSVPAIFKLPAAQAHAQSAALASALDLAPTILAQTGVPDPGTAYKGRTVAPLEGFSLLPLVRGEVASVRGPNDALVEEMYDHRYVIKGQYKLERTDPLYYGWSVLMDHNWQLFDILGDRGEVTVLDERDYHALTETVDIPGDPYNATVDGLVADWQAYVQRTGLTLPPAE
jgi:arylsulfatase